MLNLWLARHGEAVDPDRSNSDFERTLTETGRRRMSEMTQWLIAREPTPELILHSPLVRTRQTAEIIADAIGSESVVRRVENRLAPGVDTEQLLKYLATTAAEHVVCVGHQPDMSRCLAEMIGGGHVLFFPGTIARIQFDGPILRGAGHLRWLTDPSWFD